MTSGPSSRAQECSTANGHRTNRRQSDEMLKCTFTPGREHLRAHVGSSGALRLCHGANPITRPHIGHPDISRGSCCAQRRIKIMPLQVLQALCGFILACPPAPSLYERSSQGVNVRTRRACLSERTHASGLTDSWTAAVRALCLGDCYLGKRKGVYLPHSKITQHGNKTTEDAKNFRISLFCFFGGGHPSRKL